MYNKTRNRGLAFVEMASEEEALAALNSLESYVSCSCCVGVGVFMCQYYLL